MRRPWHDVVRWLDDRAGIQSAVHRFMFEDIPGSSGWRQVFGSVALFLLLIQAFTGLLLSFNFAPTATEAYTSIRYILTQVTAGRIIRGLHHWGASVFIVATVLHLAQVFLFGAYKRPREATWISGVTLFLFALAFGLTGYLLPWDNRAYWGTVITTRIASQAPFLGRHILVWLGADTGVGTLTFARFYSLHVLVLPAITTLGVLLHVCLVRRHRVAPLPSDNWLPSKKFYPGQVFRDTIAIFGSFLVLFAIALFARVPLDQMADPSDSTYVPRPEWYFLFLFQLLKLFSGPLELVGTVILPSFAVLALVLVPFIDRGKMVRVTKRVMAFTFVALTTLAWTGLTVAALRSTPPQTANIDYSAPIEWLQASPANLAAVAYFRNQNCITCHANSSHLLSGKDITWLTGHINQYSKRLPKSLTSDITAFFRDLDSSAVALLGDAPEYAVEGAKIYQQNHCGLCHIVNGVGGSIAPQLNGLSRRRSRSWIEQHFLDPKKFVADTRMPSFHLSHTEVASLTTYLLSLEAR